MEQVKTEQMTVALRSAGFDRVALRKGIWIVHHPFSAARNPEVPEFNAIIVRSIRDLVKDAFYNRYVIVVVETESHKRKGTTIRFKLDRNEELVTVKNLLGGYCQIPAYIVGTCCDPSTERYHSM